MLVGQQLGPFLIEKELGAGAMGAVYRGKYVKTGQTVAVKVMAPGLGTSGGSSAARFEDEAKILKQLNHRNIVRIFGSGRHHGTPYYAMEYIQGESLDHVMARRDRMTWEEVVDIGQQLCAALQHAHEKGIIHRDLKPSNLMILPDGTLKLTDFGIAKDLDATARTAANCTVGTAAYMSPEQCQGDRNLTHKTDLYSLGVVLYELITGKKPFVAENAMEMFLLHVQGEFVRPSKIVLDIPIWLDNLICQLLEKKPEHRPLDAATVAQALGSIQEKVEAQQSAGVDAARARLLDRPRGQRQVSDEDREAARTLLGKKGKRKAKKDGRKLIWLQAAGLLFVLAGVITVLIIALKPDSGEKLYRQAEKRMTSSNPEDWDKGREGPVREYLQRFGKDTAHQEKAAQVRAWANLYDLRRYEGLMDRYVRQQTEKKLAIAVQAQSKEEEMGFAAGLAEHKGEQAKAVELWKAVLDREGPARMGLVAQKHLILLERIATTDRELQDLLVVLRDRRSEPKLDEFSQRAFLVLRQQRLGDFLGARRRCEELRTAAGKLPVPSELAACSAERDVPRFWALYAAVKIHGLEEKLKDKPQDNDARKKLVEEEVERIAGEMKKETATTLDLWVRAQTVVVLYDQEERMTEAVKRAKQLREQLARKLEVR